MCACLCAGVYIHNGWVTYLFRCNYNMKICVRVVMYVFFCVVCIMVHSEYMCVCMCCLLEYL